MIHLTPIVFAFGVTVSILARPPERHPEVANYYLLESYIHSIDEGFFDAGDTIEENIDASFNYMELAERLALKAELETYLASIESDNEAADFFLAQTHYMLFIKRGEARAVMELILQRLILAQRR